MTLTDVQPIALAILTSIITGGFVLVLVEIGNRKNRENDRHEQIMRPFMHRLSAYFRFVSWCSSRIIYPKPLNDYEKFFKKLVNEIGIYGGRAITSGGDYGIGYFTAKQLNDIASDINNIWYWHDKMNPCRMTWDGRMGGDFIQKELKEVNPIYLGFTEDVNLVAKVSGDFYTDIYQPIEYETYRHEAYAKQYKRHTVLVCAFVSFVLLVLSLMLFVIGDQLLNMSLEFRNLENPKITELDTIIGLIETKHWTEACKVPYHARRSNVTEDFVYDYYEVQRTVASLINDYKEYLSSEQLVLLESLRESQLNVFFSVAEGQGQGFVFSDYFYEQVMKPSYRKLLEDYNKLTESI